MRRTAISLVLLVFVGYLQAQKSSDEKEKCKITSFNISMGFYGVFAPNTIEDYFSLKNSLENPKILVDPSGMQENYYYSSISGNASPKISIGITPYSKKRNEYRENRELRIGIGFNFGNRRSYSFYDKNSIPFDTLHSTSGNKVYADSVFIKAYDYSENFVDFNFSISYLFKTDIAKRVYLYAGLGVEYGIALRYYLTANSYQSDYVSYYTGEPSSDDVYQFYYGKQNYSSKHIDANLKGPAQFVRLFVPMGINFRISNNNSFFKHINIYSELSPGIEFQMISNEKTFVNPYFGLALVGFSYRF